MSPAGSEPVASEKVLPPLPPEEVIVKAYAESTTEVKPVNGVVIVRVEATTRFALFEVALAVVPFLELVTTTRYVAESLVDVETKERVLRVSPLMLLPFFCH